MLATAYLKTETNVPFYFEEYTPEKLRDFIKDKYGTLDSFADKTGFSISNVKKWVLGHRTPNLDNLGELGKTFGVYFYADWPESEKAPDESEA